MKSTLHLNIQKVEYAARKIRSIAHPLRTAIIQLLNEHEQLNITQIINLIEVRQEEISHHLVLLRAYGILQKKRSGKMSIYSLDKKAFDLIISVSEELSKNK